MSKHIFYIYSIMLIITVITVIVSVTQKGNRQNPNHDYYDFSQNWLTEDNLSADLTEISGLYTVKTTLPTLREGDVLYFNVKTLNVTIYKENECIYTSEIFNPNFFGYTSGSYFIRIPFSIQDSGKQLTMVLNNPYHDGSGKITQMQIGNSIDMLLANISGNFFGLCISVIIVFIGFAFIIFFFPMWKNRAAGKELLYFGCFAFCIGTYMLTDCKLLQELFQNAHIYHVISEIFMMLIVIPMFLFFESMYHSDYVNSKILFGVCLFSIFDFIISYFLAVTGTMDYHETIFTTHFIYIIATLALFIVTLRNYLHGYKINKFHIWGIISICSCVILDIVLFNFAAIRDTSFFTKIGTLFFMCFEAGQLLSNLLKDFKKDIKSEILEKLAYQDGLTELLNRTSYIEDIRVLEKETSTDVLVAFFDLNNLKPINDTLGHNFGDKILVAVATTLRDCFSHLGKCYRIGGDEFVVIATGNDLEKEFLQADELMQQKFAKLNDAQVFSFKLSVASGYAIWTDKTKSLNDVIQEADEKMYCNKKKMKASQK